MTVRWVACHSKCIRVSSFCTSLPPSLFHANLSLWPVVSCLPPKLGVCLDPLHPRCRVLISPPHPSSPACFQQLASSKWVGIPVLQEPSRIVSPYIQRDWSTSCSPHSLGKNDWGGGQSSLTVCPSPSGVVGGSGRTASREVSAGVSDTYQPVPVSPSLCVWGCMAQVLGCVLPPELVKRAHGSDSAIFGSDTLGASHVVCISALLMFCHQDFKKKVLWLH